MNGFILYLHKEKSEYQDFIPITEKYYQDIITLVEDKYDVTYQSLNAKAQRAHEENISKGILVRTIIFGFKYNTQEEFQQKKEKLMNKDYFYSFI